MAGVTVVALTVLVIALVTVRSRDKARRRADVLEQRTVENAAHAEGQHRESRQLAGALRATRAANHLVEAVQVVLEDRRRGG